MGSAGRYIDALRIQCFCNGKLCHRFACFDKRINGFENLQSTQMPKNVPGKISIKFILICPQIQEMLSNFSELILIVKEKISSHTEPCVLRGSERPAIFPRYCCHKFLLVSRVLLGKLQDFSQDNLVWAKL